MKIATWNVNSVKARKDRLLAWLERSAPDVACLQETKVTDELFPHDLFDELGYAHREVHGQKGYNGVAIVSRRAFEDSRRLVWTGRDDRRHAAVVLPGEIELHCFYVPSGGDKPDREINDKFGHKLDFLDEMAAWAQSDRVTERKVVIAGDFNVAPLENDVWNHKRQLRSVGHTPTESERIAKIQEAGGFIDVGRHFVPPDRPLFTWWAYRVPRSYEKGYGWRLDHVWATPPLEKQLTDMQVAEETRTWEKPSDHVPVIVDIS